jgi:tight adherence protein B
VARPLAVRWQRGNGPGADQAGIGPADIDVVLDDMAARPGAEGLRMLAACWRIGADRGGTFAAVVHGVASALRDEEAQRQEIAAQLAGPRTTAHILAGLPLVGFAMALALDADPVGFLFGTIPGFICLTLGIGLNVLGLWWTRRMAKSAERVR